ncbi:MAG: hypothetical protein HY226_01510 [Candidatus Vogelbacteria bacterium]|nr:hypothetical protein [Candidatus Vogelbacteria bacterium]
MDPNKILSAQDNQTLLKTIPEWSKSSETIRTKEQQEDYEKSVIEIIKSGYQKMEENHNGVEGLRKKFKGLTDDNIKEVLGAKAFDELVENNKEELRRQYPDLSDDNIKKNLGAKEFDEVEERGKKYHTTSHLTTLYIRAPMMADAMGVPRDKLRLARAAISWHDTVIEVTPPPEYKPYDATKDGALDEESRLNARKENAKIMVVMAARKRGAREGDFSAGAQGNEAKSAEDLSKQMRDMNKRGRGEIFTDFEKKEGGKVVTRGDVQNAILAVDVTYPGFDGGPDYQGASFEAKTDDVPSNTELLKQNPALAKKIYDLSNRKQIESLEKNETIGADERTKKIEELKKKAITKGPRFFQPHLEKMLENGDPVPEEVLIMAMADLGGSGIATSEQFAEEGDSEFWEVFPNIEKNLKGLSNDKGMDLERQVTIDSMKGWLKSQVGFITWQALRFEKIVFLLKNKTHQLSEAKESKLRKVFGNYLNNIDEAMKRAERVSAKIDEIQTKGLKDITDPEVKKAKEEENRIRVFKYIANEMHYNVETEDRD